LHHVGDVWHTECNRLAAEERNQVSQEASGISESVRSAVDGALKFDLRSVFEVCVPYAGMPEGDDGGSGGSEGDGSGGDGSSGDGAGGGTDDKGTEGVDGSAEDAKNPKLKKLSDENAKHRNDLKKANKELEDLRKFKEEAENATKTETEKLQGENKKLTEANEKLQAQVDRLTIENAFALNHAAKFRDGEAALALLDRKEIKLEDGEVTGMDGAVDALLKAKPYLAASDDGDEGPEGEGNPSGRQHNGKKGSKKEADRAALAKKFPALQTRS